MQTFNVEANSAVKAIQKVRKKLRSTNYVIKSFSRVRARRLSKNKYRVYAELKERERWR